MDDQWLYVLRKYALHEAILTRINLAVTEQRLNLLLPADGGGMGAQMAVGSLGGTRCLVVRLHESCAVIDLDSYSVMAHLTDPRLQTNIRYSPSLQAFVCIGLGTDVAVKSPAEAGAFAPTVFPDRMGQLVFQRPEAPTVELDAGSFVLRSHEVGAGSLNQVDLLPWGIFALNAAGDAAVCQSGDGLCEIDLRTFCLRRVQRYPVAQVAGGVECLGGNIFALGGNLIYDADAGRLYMPSTPFTDCDRLAALP